MRTAAPAWDDALRRGKESVVCDLKREPELVRGLCARADVVLEGFRPGVAARARRRPGRRAARGRLLLDHRLRHGRPTRSSGRARPQLPRLGRRPRGHGSWPPADSGRRSRGRAHSVPSQQILAALVRRGRTGTGARLVVSMTHGSHELVSHRLDGDPRPRLLTGGLACYAVYETADGRHLTVGALEPVFFARLCELARTTGRSPRGSTTQSRKSCRASSPRRSRRARSTSG